MEMVAGEVVGMELGGAQWEKLWEDFLQMWVVVQKVEGVELGPVFHWQFGGFQVKGQ